MAHKKRGRQCKEWTRFEQQTSWCKNFGGQPAIAGNIILRQREQFIILAKMLGQVKILLCLHYQMA